MSWISTKHDRPILGIWVLTYSKEKEVEIAMRIVNSHTGPKGGWETKALLLRNPTPDITHWMPIPPLP